jgi:hypothetical protein
MHSPGWALLIASTSQAKGLDSQQWSHKPSSCVAVLCSAIQACTAAKVCYPHGLLICVPEASSALTYTRTPCNRLLYMEPSMHSQLSVQNDRGSLYSADIFCQHFSSVPTLTQKRLSPYCNFIKESDLTLVQADCRIEHERAAKFDLVIQHRAFVTDLACSFCCSRCH